MSSFTAAKDDWDFVEKNHVSAGRKFWKFWDKDWQPIFSEVLLLMNEVDGKTMGVSDVKKLNLLSRRLYHLLDFNRDLKINKFSHHRRIRALIAHHTNNDLHAVGFITSDFEESITVENVKQIKVRIDELDLFWQRLRKIKPSLFHTLKLFLLTLIRKDA